MKSKPRIAFVVDALPSIGGGEKTLFAALESFPNADIFTLIYNKPPFANSPIANKNITTSYLDKFPFAKKHHRILLPLMPRAIERFDLRSYDIVVSFNYAVANGVNAGGAKHFSYTYTPMRYAWGNVGIDGKTSHNNFLIDQYLRSFRKWDKAAASRIDEFSAISHWIAKRVQSAYQREARIIYPPVEVERFDPKEQREKFYVVLSRLVAHKQIELIVQAFARLKLPLKIIGDGPEKKKLQRLATTNIEFLGFQSDEHVAELLGKARGFICAAEEDFGIAIVEAQAAGCPVVVYHAGGAVETVSEGRSGIFFHEQSVECIIEGIQRCEQSISRFNVFDIKTNTNRFSKVRFQKEFSEFILGGLSSNS